MKFLIYIYAICLLTHCLLPTEAAAHSKDNPYGFWGLKADSIMDKVIQFGAFYEKVVKSYEGELYIKGGIDIRKRNFLIHYLPGMFQLDKAVNSYVVETFSELHYSAPNIYRQQVKYLTGTASNFWEADGRLLDYFHLNVYSSSLLHDKLLSPLSADARKYYNYYIDSVAGYVGNHLFRIRFVPRFRSYQLVGGYLTVSEDVWSVREIRFLGRSEMFTFDILIDMGKVGEPNEFLPVKYDVKGTFNFLGNKIDGAYMALLTYRDIEQDFSSQERKKKSKRKKLNMTADYTINTDSTAVYNIDTLAYDSLRPVPLTVQERNLYRRALESDTIAVAEKRRKAFWHKLGNAMVDYYTLDLQQIGKVRCSPLVNPFMFGYSAHNGLSYRQKFRYNLELSHNRMFSIGPSVGYNFKMKDFYWLVETDFHYLPKRRGQFHLEFGNGNRIYSSAALDDLATIPDSVFNFGQVDLKYYKDLYLKFKHSIEITNGFSIDLSLAMHRRTGVGGGPQSVHSPYPLLPPIDKLSRYYRVNNTFAPGLRLTWSPGMHFYMDGNRKVNLYSSYPSISLDWERGIKGVIPNSYEYERLEIDIHHQFRLGLLNSLHVRLGSGMFTKKDGLYFIDFANFRPYNMPTGWDDDLGGTFQLLDRRWYNASRNYLRAHLTYASPFILMRHFNKLTQYVLNERLYLSALMVPRMRPYIEAGYGIGTHAFNFGVFASFDNWKYYEWGVKLTVELFNR